MGSRLLAIAALAASTLIAGESLASGACVYATLDRGAKKVVCEKVGASSVCDRKGINGGKYHAGKVCDDLDYSAAAPPAKPHFDRIPSPLKPSRPNPGRPPSDHDWWKGEGVR